jgi:hypothetical protein
MSQTKRNAVVASPASNQAKKYETTATTWGEFKGEISDLLVGNVEAILNPGNVTLNRDDAALPTGDFRIFLIPTKNKAGVMSPSQAQGLAKEIGDAIVAAASKASDDDVAELRAELRETIEDFFGVSLDSEDCPECDEALKDAKAYLI